MGPLTDDDIRAAVRGNISIAGAIRDLGRALAGGNYTFIRDAVKRMGLDTSHWKGRNHGTSGVVQQIPLSNVMVEHSTYQRGHLKRRLLADGILENKCSVCGISEWNGKPISLHLEHKNGIRNDNRRENLCLLCPNCHSQTPTYCGRNIKHRPYIKHCACGRRIGRLSTTCRHCSPRATKITWPPIDDLRRMVAATSMVDVGKQLGVSDAAVRKHLAPRTGVEPV